MKNMILFSIVLSIVIILLSYLLTKGGLDREKITAYECGFQPFEEAKKKFYVKYYLIGIVFLIFDLEAMLLYPITVSLNNIQNSILLLNNNMMHMGYIVFIIFMVILTLGLIYELSKGILD